MKLLLAASVVGAVADPCCNTCEAPLLKYYSTDVAHGFCGEACMDPAKFSRYQLFEKNLTLAPVNSACANQYAPDGTFYTDYSSTDTHGVPGVLAVTLDLYAPTGMPDISCCAHPFVANIGCFGIPGKGTSLTIRGTGPFCCPKGATEDAPCTSMLGMVV